MRKFIILSFLTLLPVVLAFAAVVPAFAAVEHDAAADYCKCMNPLLTKMKEAQRVVQGGDMSGMSSMMAEMQAMQPKVEKCSATLEAKYGDRKDDKEFETAVTAEIEKRCPAPKFGFGG